MCEKKLDSKPQMSLPTGEGQKSTGFCDCRVPSDCGSAALRISEFHGWRKHEEALGFGH